VAPGPAVAASSGHQIRAPILGGGGVCGLPLLLSGCEKDGDWVREGDRESDGDGKSQVC
jgi:hypothetical protein